MANRLEGKIALITGAAKGMGAAHARRFVAEGARVVLGDVLDASPLAAELGDAASAITLDITSERDWAAAMAACREQGGLDVLVNNAGIHWTKPIEEQDLDGFTTMVNINLGGTFLGLKAAIGPMRERGGGSIINLSSLAGLQGLAYHGAYGASKWGVRGLTKIAAIEFGPAGVRVNSVHPGPIHTDMMPMEREEARSRFARLPLGRAGEPEEVSNLVLYLASDESSFQTGAEFVIDGGSFAGPPPAYQWPGEAAE